MGQHHHTCATNPSTRSTEGATEHEASQDKEALADGGNDTTLWPLEKEDHRIDRLLPLGGAREPGWRALGPQMGAAAGAAKGGTTFNGASLSCLQLFARVHLALLA